MKVLDLKESLFLLDQYVVLRNEFTAELLTVEVNQEETLQWLHDTNVVLLVACREYEIVGASVLYLEKEGEIAVFVKFPRQGIATLLLGYIKEKAREYHLPSVWAWVDEENSASSSMFLKNGFKVTEKKSRLYKDAIKKGSVYRYDL